MIGQLIFGFISAFLVSYTVIPFCIYLAHKLSFIDMPDGLIKVHVSPVPYLGGIGIFCALAPFLMTMAFSVPVFRPLVVLLVGLLLVGVVDDKWRLRASHKLFGQIFFVFIFLSFQNFSSCFGVPIFFIYIASFIWMLGFINAYNLIDVMDGLAAVIGIFACMSFVFFSVYSSLLGQAFGVLMSALAGSLVAYFWYNRSPARVYMGDAGSLMIGGLLATAPFYIQDAKTELIDWQSVCVCFIVLAIPLYELLSLIIIRTYYRIPFYLGSPHHFCLYLQKKNWQKQQIVKFVASNGLLLFVIAYLLHFRCVGPFSIISLLFLQLVSFFVIVFF